MTDAKNAAIAKRTNRFSRPLLDLRDPPSPRQRGDFERGIFVITLSLSTGNALKSWRMAVFARVATTAPEYKSLRKPQRAFAKKCQEVTLHFLTIFDPGLRLDPYPIDDSDPGR
jgi:hypothetical protein